MGYQRRVHGDFGPVFTFDSSERAERQPPQHKMAHDLNGKDVERAKFAFDIYDFEGKSRMDMFYLGDCLRGLNLNPTLKMIDKLGGAKKKGEKFIKLEEFYPIYSDVKKSKETGNFEDFIECLKLYDKMENGTMMLGELEHILLSLGEKLEREEVGILIKECCDPEDDDGFIPYEPFLRRVCAGPHPEMYEDWYTLIAQKPTEQQQQLSVKTTFNYQNYSWLYQQLHEPEDKTININKRCGPKSPHANF